ncbi:MAG: ATP phosphoribosyltransferase [Chloroflexota bacterium]|nr:MAG: ATP phosphoribosyltransferase [Chloroflexota bacterium]
MSTINQPDKFTQPRPRTEIRLALPSKGRMEEETRAFLHACGLSVNKVNPRQYIAQIDDIPYLEIWFQRSADVVRKVRDGDVDLGIVGFDMVVEYRGGGDDVVIIHDALGYGQCHLSVAVPEDWTDVHSTRDLAALAASRQAQRPLRVVSKYERQTTAFLEQHQIKPYRVLHADGALEAAPQMGSADFIVDLVSSGVTLRENRLKQIEGGRLLQSEMVFIGNRTTLTQRPEVLAVARQMLERIEAHLRAVEHETIIANIRGSSPEEVAQKVFSQPDLGGLQGPTISRVYLRDAADIGWYAITIVVRKDRLHQSIEQLRSIGGSGVLVLPITYIFEEEPHRWLKLLDTLGIER